MKSGGRERPPDRRRTVFKTPKIAKSSLAKHAIGRAADGEEFHKISVMDRLAILKRR
jgi:hypothetical protein